MSWSNVIILVNALDSEEAEEKALRVFETEGIIVSDGNYDLEAGEIDEDSENLSTFSAYEALNSKKFMQEFQKQIDDYQSKLSELIGLNPAEYCSLENFRNAASQYSDYLAPLISFSTKIYDGEDYCLLFDLFKVKENPNNYFFVTIRYHN